MTCPRCQVETPPDAEFCPDCGEKLSAVCAKCGTENASPHKFCKKCGDPLTLLGTAEAAASLSKSPQTYTPKHLADRILTSRSALGGERKTVTVLFCDLVESTGLASRLGPDRMHSLLDRFFDLALEEVHRCEGTVNQFLGDGFMALFGAPLAHEDHARRAALAALTIHRRVAAESARFDLPTGSPLSVRMGLNTGSVVVGKIGDNLRMDYTAVGDTTHLAARLQHLAQPGTIYVSESTWRLVRALCEGSPLGSKVLKGFPEQNGSR